MRPLVADALRTRIGDFRNGSAGFLECARASYVAHRLRSDDEKVASLRSQVEFVRQCVEVSGNGSINGAAGIERRRGLVLARMLTAETRRHG